MNFNKLTQNQIKFLLEHFFKTEEFAGWENIATQLINTGSCIVAGKNCIWQGGIGNFIKTKKHENLIDCLIYEFDLDSFLSSNWYKDIRNYCIKVISDEKKQLESEYVDIYELDGSAFAFNSKYVKCADEICDLDNMIEGLVKYTSYLDQIKAAILKAHTKYEYCIIDMGSTKELGELIDKAFKEFL